MDVAVRPRPDIATAATKEGRDQAFGFDGFGYISDASVEASPETRIALWRDGWTEMVRAAHTICEQSGEWTAEKPLDPTDLSEDDLLALNELGRKLARSTQTLLTIARDEG